MIPSWNYAPPRVATATWFAPGTTLISRISFRLTKPVVLSEIAASDGWAASITMSNCFSSLGLNSGPKVLFLVNFT